MKTIAVLTDFSEKSAHAAKYASHIARKMKVNVKLYHMQLAPAMLHARPVLSGDDYPEELMIDARLAAFSETLEADLMKRVFPGSFMPQMSVYTGSTDMVDVMTEIINDTEIVMIVMAPLETDDLASFMISDACCKIIDWTTVPVLVVPTNTPIRNIEKMAFATTLDAGDILSIAELGNLMNGFHAELMVAHLNNNPADNDTKAAEKEINHKLYTDLNCGGVYFRSVPDIKHQKDWEWLKANKRADLLAVAKRPKEQMASFFKRGQSSHITHHITIPVMVLPKRP
jgi:nucleotide-binding universal stress UspA family protein